ncbi:hypothetical protein V8F33_008166 [Rhypophila sp. PSN 637]
MLDGPFHYFGLSCPRGGKFHICQDASMPFIGCCDEHTDPRSIRNDGSFLRDDLRPLSFSTDKKADIPMQDCDHPRGSSILWICDDIDSPFFGCCASDPCGQPGGACLPEELFPMKLSSDKAARNSFLFPNPPSCVGCTQAQQGGFFSTIATVITKEKTTITVYATATGTVTTSTTPTSVSSAPSGTPTSGYDGGDGDAGGGGTSPGLIHGIVAGVVIGLLSLLFGVSRTKWYKRIRAKRSDANRASSLGQSSPETSHGYYAHDGKYEASGLNHARLTRLLQDSHGVRLSGTTVASQLLSPVFPNSRVSKLRVVNETSSTHNPEQGGYVAASVTEDDETPDLNLQQVHRFADFTAGGYRPMRLVVHGSQADMGDVDSVEETGDYDKTDDRRLEVVEWSVAIPTEDIQPAVAPLGGDGVKAEYQPGHDNEQQEALEVGLGLGFVGKSAF